jgi:uncharacterized protein (DUF111 family)
MAHGRDDYRSRENRRLLRELLMKEWDPIGVRGIPAAHDEYDRYVEEIYVMLVDGDATIAEMERYLEEVELEYMGLRDVPARKERRPHIAAALLQLRSTFLDTH